MATTAAPLEKSATAFGITHSYGTLLNSSGRSEFGQRLTVRCPQRRMPVHQPIGKGRHGSLCSLLRDLLFDCLYLVGRQLIQLGQIQMFASLYNVVLDEP